MILYYGQKRWHLLFSPKKRTSILIVFENFISMLNFLPLVTDALSTVMIEKKKKASVSL